MYTAVCPYEIEKPVMLQRWARLSFLHWSFDPEAVQRLLPSSLTVETFDDRAWVGLVPFLMHVWVPHTREVPWASRFCETNVRTYVVDANGQRGIWFFSLDAARWGAVVTARTTYRLPYFWSRMSLRGGGSSISYACERRWPGPTVQSRTEVEIGDAYRVDELGNFDHWLTARWLLYSVRGRRHRSARAWHAPWPLYRATAPVWDDALLRAAGLPPSTDEPIVHYSPGVDVRIGLPQR